MGRRLLLPFIEGNQHRTTQHGGEKKLLGLRREKREREGGEREREEGVSYSITFGAMFTGSSEKLTYQPEPPPQTHRPIPQFRGMEGGVKGVNGGEEGGGLDLRPGEQSFFTARV